MGQVTTYQEEVRKLFFEKVQATPSALTCATEKVEENALWLRLIPPGSNRCPLMIMVEEDFCDLELGTNTHIDTDKYPLDFLDQVISAVLSGNIKEIIWSYKKYTLRTELYVKMREKYARFIVDHWGWLLVYLGLGTRQEIQYQAY